MKWVFSAVRLKTKKNKQKYECVNVHETKPYTLDNCNVTKQDRHVCMVIKVNAPVILVGSVFLNKFYINIKYFICIAY